jgi:hypothetical protein
VARIPEFRRRAKGTAWNLGRALAKDRIFCGSRRALMSGEGHAPSNGSVDSLVADQRWFLEDMDVGNGDVSFVRADRETLSPQTFLDARWDRSALPHRRAKLDAVVAKAATPERPPLDFIWHTAFCCSTLVSRALDRPGHNLSLREPLVLVRLADLKREGYFARNRLSSNIPSAVFHLLARPFVPGAHVTVKPSNAVNCLLRDAAKLTTGKMLFLYSDCRSFLISVAKKKEQGRRFARRMFALLTADGLAQPHWRNPFEMTDLEIAALVWHMQIAEFQRTWPMLGPGRAASLDCDAFLGMPGTTISGLDRFFEFGLGTDHIVEILKGPLLKKNAKALDESFGVRRRIDEHRSTSRQIGQDLDRIVAWSYEACQSTPGGNPLPNPIIRLNKAYHP